MDFVFDYLEENGKPSNYDRVYRNPDDGQVFYGYDDGDGNTDWYDENNNLDSSTPTPSEDTQAAWDDGYYGVNLDIL